MFGELMKKKIVVLTNIPSPYRVSLFQHIRAHYLLYDLIVIYQARLNDDRSWKIEQKDLCNDIFLNTITLNTRDHLGRKPIRLQTGLSKVMRELKPEVVVISEYNPVAISLAMWCKNQKTPYISWTDGTIYFERNINFLQKVARKFIIPNAKAYIASSSRSIENQMKYGAKREKVYLSQLTVDTEPLYFEKNNFSSRQLLFVGRLVEMKGIDLLLKALYKIREMDWNLNIVGDGILEGELRELANHFSISNKVKFCGFYEGNELMEYYRKSDIFILPSREEPYGLVTLEAMCASMPVICSKYAEGAYDLVVEGETGDMVNPFDTDEFVNVLKSYIGDTDKVKRMGLKAYQKSKNFSIEKSARQFMEAVESI